MNVPRSQTARRSALLLAAGLSFALAACLGAPDVSSTALAGGDPASPRVAAIAEMRAKAVAGDAMPYPDVFQSEQTALLAARAEPRSIREVDAIENELALIAERRAATADPREIAALEARARELRRLVLAAEPGTVRR